MNDRFNLRRCFDVEGTRLSRGSPGASGGAEREPLDVVRLSGETGIGQSPTSIRFAIASLEEARAYLVHPVLGPRLRECTKLALDAEERTARQIFGPIDEMKLRSSMTLFMTAAPDELLFFPMP